MVPIDALPILGMGLLVLDEYWLIYKNPEAEEPQDNHKSFFKSLFKRALRCTAAETPDHLLGSSGVSLISSGLLFSSKSNDTLPLSTVAKTFTLFFMIMNLIRLGATYQREWKKEEQRFKVARDLWIRENRGIEEGK